MIRAVALHYCRVNFGISIKLGQFSANLTGEIPVGTPEKTYVKSRRSSCSDIGQALSLNSIRDSLHFLAIDLMLLSHSDPSSLGRS